MFQSQEHSCTPPAEGAVNQQLAALPAVKHLVVVDDFEDRYFSSGFFARNLICFPSYTFHFILNSFLVLVRATCPR